jgi:hypothetical protein
LFAPYGKRVIVGKCPYFAGISCPTIGDFELRFELRFSSDMDHCQPTCKDTGVRTTYIFMNNS